MVRIERDIKKWLGDGKTFTDRCEHSLVRAVLGSFMAVYIQHTEEMEILEVLARVCGYNDVRKMLGASICEANGSRTLNLKVAP